MGRAERLSVAMRQVEPTDPAFAQLSRMCHDETTMALLLASILRITPRSNREPRDVREERAPQPWERE
jgi:hypothetical protein